MLRLRRVDIPRESVGKQTPVLVRAGMKVRTIGARLLPALLLVGACSSQAEESVTHRNIDAACVEEEPEDDAWVCEETREIACEDDAGLELVVQLDEGACAGADLQGVDGPFGPGTHEIEIEDEASGEVVCTATLEVVDENAPEFETEEIELWPPNHKMHEISLSDCITEINDCDEEVEARVLWVSSDEADNDKGDGNTSDDVALVDEDRVSLRSERQGGSNGRVYTIGFELSDDDGNTSEGECRVSVPHDQSGSAAVDDGAAYVIEADV